MEFRVESSIKEILGDDGLKSLVRRSPGDLRPTPVPKDLSPTRIGVTGTGVV